MYGSPCFPAIDMDASLWQQKRIIDLDMVACSQLHLTSKGKKY